ncbi:GNAT family N-acetyltransferase [Brachybacterium sp. FME24]|uniref:GNAT family N-acetyltransferase n=1 Tax=Brachybacterium sp. FME24 TaxID=2742605 RepID=UPI001D00D7BC|nr:GNAT family N-acetyltransferase [Brachybacterium sp. FME24]
MTNVPAGPASADSAMTPEVLLAAYDEQLRTGAETANAMATIVLGPLLLATFPGGRGFVTYRDLAECDRVDIEALVARVKERVETDESLLEVEWKSRGHDRAPGLHEALTAHGFVAEEPESIMLGDAAALAIDVPLPRGVTLHQIRERRDVRAMSAMTDEVFGDSASGARAEEILRRLAMDDGLELWIARAEGRIVSVGRLEPVPGTRFAGIWGGATLAPWRGRGIYRALTAARARSALALGRTLLHSDSTEFSRPILERSGLLKVSTTTPYLWRR